MSDAPILVNFEFVAAARKARHAVLSSAGFVVHDAATGDEAVNLVEQHRADLAVLHTPDNGDNLSRRLKAAPIGSTVAVLRILDRPGSAQNGGADLHLIEPVNPEMLVETVRGMLRWQQAERALAETKARLEASQEDLRRSNEDLQQFAFAASHDLQEPLRTITSFVQLIEQEAQSHLTDAEKGYLAHVVTGTGKMRSLINDLLVYSRVGRTNMIKGRIDMTAVVAWAIETLHTEVSESGAKIHVAEPLPKAWGDFAQLGQVIQNLLSNAIKYRRKQVPLAIEIAGENCDGNECVIRVRDNGSGIAPEYYEKAFAPFKRLHGQDIPGTGIGLAVCRRIMEAHGGKIWLESKPDEGSTFLLRLPTAPKS